MKVEDIKVIGVCGAGTMGSGIAQVAATSGFQVILRDISDEALERGLNIIKKSLGRIVKKGKMAQEQADEILGRIKTTKDLADMKDADYVIEAVFEKMEIKKEIFGELDEITRPEVVLATNTSSLSITEIAASTSRPDKVVGMHFFNPVPVLPLVEIVQGLTTSDETVELAYQLAKKMGKSPIKTKDQPGFIVNRILVPYMNEAAWAYMEGVGSVEEIDEAMKLGANMPIGPLALIDLVGVDITLDVLEVLYREFGDPKFRPAPILRQMVRAGHLGRKTGKGFYTYEDKT
ncbi:3-hydroxyacyl-CoA dehydrogenase family protein [Thermosulfidibacter takaii]|uniref:3-hydroxyacyl-CoA dehydrogenase family protein n=1 Tax=Thermosulfidibacter takaii TaxID=412593 RepID=UPI000838FBE7|nr:3-hydroxybutyryl-CoA dehydrogenase [Thermosulfidibacter takaii]